jgi:hypothetical protein
MDKVKNLGLIGMIMDTTTTWYAHCIDLFSLFGPFSAWKIQTRDLGMQFNWELFVKFKLSHPKSTGEVVIVIEILQRTQ